MFSEKLHDVGDGFCSMAHGVMAVRNKNAPRRFILQHSISDTTYYYRMGHTLFMLSSQRGLKRSKPVNQFVALVFDQLKFAEDIGSQLAIKTSRPVPHYETMPHYQVDHVCVQLPVIIEDIAGRRRCHGLACFDKSTNKLIVWFTVCIALMFYVPARYVHNLGNLGNLLQTDDGRASCFSCFEHRFDLAEASDYGDIADVGIYKLGSSGYSVRSDRPKLDRNSRQFDLRLREHMSMEKLLWLVMDDVFDMAAVALAAKKAVTNEDEDYWLLENELQPMMSCPSESSNMLSDRDCFWTVPLIDFNAYGPPPLVRDESGYSSGLTCNDSDSSNNTINNTIWQFDLDARSMANSIQHVEPFERKSDVEESVESVESVESAENAQSTQDKKGLELFRMEQMGLALEARLDGLLVQLDDTLESSIHNDTRVTAVDTAACDSFSS